MICPDLDPVLATFKIVSPCFQGMHDVHHFFIMHIIIIFCVIEPFFFLFGVDNLYTTISKYMCGLASRYQLIQKKGGKRKDGQVGKRPSMPQTETDAAMHSIASVFLLLV